MVRCTKSAQVVSFSLNSAALAVPSSSKLISTDHLGWIATWLARAFGKVATRSFAVTG